MCNKLWGSANYLVFLINKNNIVCSWLCMCLHLGAQHLLKRLVDQNLELRLVTCA
eukprot:XP_001706197.1 Hypothetical protein GL50803_115036 [Giardia lamblia ATCC 50803]